MLRREYERLGQGQDLIELPVLDTMYLPRVVGHPSEDLKLSTLLASFGLTNAKHHDVAADADATAELLLALLKVAASNGFSDLERLRVEGGDADDTQLGQGAGQRGGRQGRQPRLDAHSATHAVDAGPVSH